MIKRIIVPVDFSEISVNAIDLSVELANRMQANLRLMHVRTGKRLFPEFAMKNPDLLLADLDITYMNDLLKRALSKSTVPNREFDFKIREGNVVREITNQAHYDDAALIVIGTHGISGFEDRWVGSNAYRLTSHAPCPVLTVRKEVPITDEFKILLPIDHSKFSRRIVSRVARFAQSVGIKIYLLGVNENSRWFKPGSLGYLQRQIEGYLQKKINIQFESVSMGGTLTPQQTLEYAEENNITFIALPVRKSLNPFDSFFNPFANELLNISTLPVLVVPEKNF
ncbi:MAG: universal stress protein [Marinilabiliaceae bacterium]|nr:universal stress protein [Marinilabiliaceae bacterium]